MCRLQVKMRQGLETEEGDRNKKLCIRREGQEIGAKKKKDSILNLERKKRKEKALQKRNRRPRKGEGAFGKKNGNKSYSTQGGRGLKDQEGGSSSYIGGGEELPKGEAMEYPMLFRDRGWNEHSQQREKKKRKVEGQERIATCSRVKNRRCLKTRGGRSPAPGKQEASTDAKKERRSGVKTRVLRPSRKVKEKRRKDSNTTGRRFWGGTGKKKSVGGNEARMRSKGGGGRGSGGNL